MNNNTDSSNIREKIVLFIYIIYSAAVIAAAVIYKWANWIAPLILALVVICCIQYAVKMKSYFFRGFCTSIAVWATFSMILANSDDFIGDFSMATALSVLLSVYCIREITMISAGFFSFHVLYRLIMVQDISISFSYEGIHTLVCISSVYVVMLLTSIMIKTQSEANEKIEENLDSIRRAEQTKDDFLANISHEIRTPVNTICGISEIIVREDLPDDIHEEIRDIQNAGHNLLSIVSDILDFTEFSSGKSVITPVTYNITSTISDILALIDSRLSGRGLELIVNCDANLPCGLVGDEEKIRRSVLNILDNAVKFTREGGIILSVTSRREIYGVNLIFTIKDTGIGMNEEALENLFTTYAQVDTKRNRQEGGLGLGMFITKTIVNRMGGFMAVNSTPGKGTEVQLVFPQKIADDDPIVSVDNPENYHVMVYIDMEKYQYADIRNGYDECVRKLVQDLKVNAVSCASLSEVKHRAASNSYTHVFISWDEYCLDKTFFDDLSEKIKVVLVTNRDHRENISGKHIICTYKPFYVYPIACILNGQYSRTAEESFSQNNFTRFTAPTANIMVVDDNLMNLKVTEGLMRPYKVRVYTAGSGKAALKKLDSVKPDMIFMDHMMPEMDGVETFHHIRKRSGIFFQNVPVIALTANAVSGAREMFLREGFADYITKPIDISSLERILRTYIPARKIIRQNDSDDKNKIQKKDAGFELEGIDTALGMDYCNGNPDDYIDVIRVYYDISKERISDIRRFCEAKDWENYTILVHAIKSTSLNIGAVTLSGMAERLETAGKRHKTEAIEADNDAMLAEYERVLKVIRNSSVIFPEMQPEKSTVTDTCEITPEELSAKLDELAGCIDTFETEKINNCIEKLSNYTCGDINISEYLVNIREKAEKFDFISAGEEIEKLRRNVR